MDAIRERITALSVTFRHNLAIAGSVGAAQLGMPVSLIPAAKRGTHESVVHFGEEGIPIPYWTGMDGWHLTRLAGHRLASSGGGLGAGRQFASLDSGKNQQPG